MMYQEVLNNLQNSINKKGLSLMFGDSIKRLKNEFGEDVSTKFLSDLCYINNPQKKGFCNLENGQKKAVRINYLMRKNGLTTTRTLNFYKVRGVNGHKAEIIEWGADKKTQPFPTAELTENEKLQIAEIKALQEETGISLFNQAETDFNDREKTTHAFNFGGGAVIRDVKVVKVGSFRVEKRSEVLFMVD